MKTPLISKERLLTIKTDRQDVNNIILMLNQKLTESQQKGLKSYIWEAYMIKDNEIVNYDKLALLIVISELHKSGYNTNVFESMGSDRIKIEIYWNKEDKSGKEITKFDKKLDETDTKINEIKLSNEKLDEITKKMTEFNNKLNEIETVDKKIKEIKNELRNFEFEKLSKVDNTIKQVNRIEDKVYNRILQRKYRNKIKVWNIELGRYEIVEKD